MIRLLNNIKLQYRASTCTEWCKITIRHLIACSHIIIYLCSKELNGEQQIYTARCISSVALSWLPASSVILSSRS